jgi:hypothetical protein
MALGRAGGLDPSGHPRPRWAFFPTVRVVNRRMRRVRPARYPTRPDLRRATSPSNERVTRCDEPQLTSFAYTQSLLDVDI